MNLKLIFLAALIVSGFASIGYKNDWIVSAAQSSTIIYCQNNVTLVSNFTDYRCQFGECFTLEKSEKKICEFGCYGGTIGAQCAPDPFQNVLLFGAIVIVVLIIVAWAARSRN